MTTHKSEDYKVSAVNYYLTEDTTQEEDKLLFNFITSRYKNFIFLIK